MAIDTRNRRASCLGIASGGIRTVYPNPDGSIASQADRQHSAYCYPGILASAPGGTTVVSYEGAFFRFERGGIWRRMN